MKISSCVDWITMSITGNTELAFSNCKLKFKHKEPCDPIARYPTAWYLEPAGRKYLGVTKEQGTLIQLSGQDLSILRNTGFGEFSLLSEVQKLGKCTRLDFAVDLKEDLDLSELEDQWEEEKHVTKFKKKPLIIRTLGGEDGYTMYLGSSKADVRIRVYDKAAQLKIPDDFWSRIELQARRKRADSLLDDMILGDWYDVGRECITGYIDFPEVEWWREAMQHDNAVISTLPKPTPRWQLWMDTQVLPSIEKRIGNKEDMLFLEAWIENVWKTVTKTK